MKLLIVESPAKAKTINKYLGKEYKVISSYGHIRALPSETGSVKPEEGFSMNYQVLPKSGKQVAEIIKNATKSESIMLATDPDREGEAISWHIHELLKQQKSIPSNIPIKRITFNEITKKAINEAVSNPRDLDLNLIHAQQARQALDYLVGFTLSPVLWRKLPGSRSAGRVQSVALRMICERESEIERFKTQEYWSIHALLSNKDHQKFPATLICLDGKKLEKFSLKNKEDSEKAIAKIANLQYSVSSVEDKKLSRKPSPPFTTSTMLQEASRKLGFSAKRTSQLAQKLYEGIDLGGETIGLITYMRTDSVNVSKEAVEETRKLINIEFGHNYAPKASRHYSTKSKNAQEAHEAIRPTNVALSPQKISQYLDKDLLRLYDLIWKRMVASQMADATFALVTADITDSQKMVTLRATGSTLIFEGFLKLYKEDSDDEEEEDKKLLPPLNKDDKIECLKVEPKQHFTQPPPRFSEASLVKKMEELGIGRPSTYPTIISILQEREYVKLDKKRFIPEAKGRIVSAFLSAFFHKYVEYSFTSDLENKLDDISNGSVSFLSVLEDFWTPFKNKTSEVLEFKNQDVIQQIEQLLQSYIFPNCDSENPDDCKKCPNCQTGVLGLKAGKFGAFIGCSNYPQCNYVKPLSSSSSESDLQNSDTQSYPAKFEPIILGTDSSTNEEISVRKGPYGFYVQRGEGKAAKRSSLPKDKTPDTVDLDYALKLLNFPLLLGKHPKNDMEIKVGRGRFGPYIEMDGQYTSIKGHNPMEITLEHAVKILEEAPSKTAKKPIKKKK